MEEYSRRLESVRAQMAEFRLDALIVPRADEYLGEYIPAHNERLRWITGFTGSAGVAIVLRESAAIFVDGRYTEQVQQQVSSELFEILHLVEEPHLQWLVEQLNSGARVGYDSRMHPLRWQQQASKTLGKASIELIPVTENLIDRCWLDRPLPELHPAILLEEKYTGQGSASKRQEIGELITAAGADAAYIFAADSVAWLLNLRGRDVPCLPLVLGSGLLYANGEMMFFCDPEKIPEGFIEHVGEGVEVLAETDIAKAFAALAGKTIMADPQTANAWSQLALKNAGAVLLGVDDPVILPKACKSDIEVQGMRNAHIRDGVAEVQFLAWLDTEVAAGNLHDEAVLSDKLYAFRARQDLFQETSFDTISAAGPNAAMAHYNHVNGTPADLMKDTAYLVDSGGQYLDGTTDITRTVAIGDPGEEVRRMFTLVLKGCIALDKIRFPDGTTGGQLDILARQFLWQQGFDYDHGTGHGVGSFLSVHEGPQRIGKVVSDVALKPGMVVSDEPGYYKTDRYGMRCENLVVVTEIGKMEDTGRPWYGFEVLTMVPFDMRMIDVALLTPAELNWLNSYHSKVLAVIGPLLEGSDLQWLEAATSPL
ncbi:MAG: aminopeptidase P family protein [Gammaproteobacteria bacterium]|nr:aminopeptidase P family protein [Gammaproteobacteria bacterium]